MTQTAVTSKTHAYAGASQVNLLVVGDSLPFSGIMPYGWLTKVETDMPWIAADDAAFGGDTLTQTLMKLDANPFAGTGDQLMLVWGGSNDAYKGIDPSDSLANLQTIVNLGRARGMDVVVLNVLPRLDTDIAGITALDGLIAANLTGADKIDVYSKSLVAPGSQNPAWFADGTHLTPDGHSAIAAIVEDYLASLTGRPGLGLAVAGPASSQA